MPGGKCQQGEDTCGCGHQRQADTLGAYQGSPGLQAGWHLHLEKLTIVQYMKPGAGYSMAPWAGPRCEAVLRRGKGAKKAVQVAMGVAREPVGGSVAGEERVGAWGGGRGWAEELGARKGGRSVIPSGRPWEGSGAGAVQVGDRGLPDGGGAGTRKCVGGPEASMQQRAGLSVKTTDSDSREATIGHKTLPVGRGSVQGARHHPSHLFSCNGVPDSGGKAGGGGGGGGRLGGGGSGIRKHASSRRQAVGIAHQLLCQQGPGRREIDESV